MVVHIDDRGVKRVSGGRDLKSTQAYPRGFGLALVALYEKHQAELQATATAMAQKAQAITLDDGDFVIPVGGAAAWKDAQLRATRSLPPAAIPKYRRRPP